MPYLDDCWKFILSHCLKIHDEKSRYSRFHDSLFVSWQELSKMFRICIREIRKQMFKHFFFNFLYYLIQKLFKLNRAENLIKNSFINIVNRTISFQDITR